MTAFPSKPQPKQWIRAGLLQELKAQGRLQRVTLPALKAAGAASFCWLGAGEQVFVFLSASLASGWATGFVWSAVRTAWAGDREHESASSARWPGTRAQGAQCCGGVLCTCDASVTACMHVRVLPARCGAPCDRVSGQARSFCHFFCSCASQCQRGMSDVMRLAAVFCGQFKSGAEMWTPTTTGGFLYAFANPEITPIYFPRRQEPSSS